MKVQLGTFSATLMLDLAGMELMWSKITWRLLSPFRCSPPSSVWNGEDGVAPDSSRNQPGSSGQSTAALKPRNEDRDTSTIKFISSTASAFMSRSTHDQASFIRTVFDGNKLGRGKESYARERAAHRDSSQATLRQVGTKDNQVPDASSMDVTGRQGRPKSKLSYI